ncbi:MAG: hypothetical protein R6V01_03355 [Thermoplasmatota archaeon]
MENDVMNVFRRSVIKSFEDEFGIESKEDLGFVREMADLVIKEFNGETIVDDDEVNPEIRDVLYLLEAMGILKMEITEKHIIDGRIWKNHYWVINERRAESILRKKKIEEMDISTKITHPYDIYNKLPDEIWAKTNRPGVSAPSYDRIGSIGGRGLLH